MNETPPDISQAQGTRLSALGLLVGFIAGLPRLFFPIVAVFFSAGRSEDGAAFMPAIIAGILVFSFLIRWIKWTRFRYFIGDDDVRIESGLFNRTARSIPFDRIQDVSIEQKPLARIFDLGEVRFETGSGAGDDGVLSYVMLAQAERLREQVRAHKSGITADIAADISGAAKILDDAPPIFAMDINRVLTLGFYSFSLFILAVLGGLAQQFDFLLPFDLWDFRYWLGLAEENGATLDQISFNARIAGAVIALIFLISIGLAAGIIRTFLREYGFRLDHTAKGFRRRRGLLTLTDTNMPAHRVQAAVIKTGPIRKRRGWHSLSFISLASDGGEKEQNSSDHAAAPLAKMDEIATILRAAGVEAADHKMSYQRGEGAWWTTQFFVIMMLIMAAGAAAMAITNLGLSALALFALPVLAGIFLCFQWRNFRYALSSDQLFVRRGWWDQKMTIAPQVKIQTVEISQGPLARMRGLARLQLGMAGGKLQIIALRIETARVLRDQLVSEIVKVDYADMAPAD